MPDTTLKLVCLARRKLTNAATLTFKAWQGKDGNQGASASAGASYYRSLLRRVRAGELELRACDD
jgi:hypothetical protein